MGDVIKYFAEPEGEPVEEFPSFAAAFTRMEDFDGPGEVTMGLSPDKPRVLLARRAGNGWWDTYIANQDGDETQTPPG